MNRGLDRSRPGNAFRPRNEQHLGTASDQAPSSKPKFGSWNHEEHEVHEVFQCAIDDRTVTGWANLMTAIDFNHTLMIFVFLRVLRGELRFLG